MAIQFPPKMENLLAELRAEQLAFERREMTEATRFKLRLDIMALYSALVGADLTIEQAKDRLATWIFSALDDATMPLFYWRKAWLVAQAIKESSNV